MKCLMPLIAGFLAAVVAAEDTVDWRLELLKETDCRPKPMR